MLLSLVLSSPLFCDCFNAFDRPANGFGLVGLDGKYSAPKPDYSAGSNVNGWAATKAPETSPLKMLR
jgi:hypothetical protein